MRIRICHNNNPPASCLKIFCCHPFCIQLFCECFKNVLNRLNFIFCSDAPGEIGSIDENGVFTAAGEHGATGTITCTAGTTTATIAVTLQQTLPAESLQEWIREIVQIVNEE